MLVAREARMRPQLVESSLRLVFPGAEIVCRLSYKIVEMTVLLTMRPTPALEFGVTGFSVDR